MISEQINFLENDLVKGTLKAALQKAFEGREGELIKFGNIALVDAYNDGSSQSLENVVVVSVVNFEEEKTFKNQPRRAVHPGNNGEPISLGIVTPLFFNLYVLFSANFKSYSDSIKSILVIADFFRNHPVQNNSHFRLIFDLHPLGFEALNHLWGFLGGKSLPAIMYKVRLVELPQVAEPGGELIHAIRNDQQYLNN